MTAGGFAAECQMWVGALDEGLVRMIASMCPKRSPRSKQDTCPKPWPQADLLEGDGATGRHLQQHCHKCLEVSMRLPTLLATLLCPCFPWLGLCLCWCDRGGPCPAWLLWLCSCLRCGLALCLCWRLVNGRCLCCRRWGGLLSCLQQDRGCLISREPCWALSVAGSSLPDLHLFHLGLLDRGLPIH